MAYGCPKSYEKWPNGSGENFLVAGLILLSLSTDPKGFVSDSSGLQVDDEDVPVRTGREAPCEACILTIISSIAEVRPHHLDQAVVVLMDYLALIFDEALLFQRGVWTSSVWQLEGSSLRHHGWHVRNQATTPSMSMTRLRRTGSGRSFWMTLPSHKWFVAWFIVDGCFFGDTVQALQGSSPRFRCLSVCTRTQISCS